MSVLAGFAGGVLGGVVASVVMARASKAVARRRLAATMAKHLGRS